MSIFTYLQLQPVEPTDDGTVSPLDEYEHDEVIDLEKEEDGEALIQEWDMVINDMHEDPDKINFDDEA